MVTPIASRYVQGNSSLNNYARASLTALKQTAMKRLCWTDSYNSIVKAAISRVFESGSNADKKEVLQHLINCLKDPELVDEIRDEYAEILRNLNMTIFPGKKGTAFTDLNLTGLDMSGLKADKLIFMFNGSDLRGANFSGAQLHFLGLEDTNLCGANLTGLQCKILKLSNANASYAILRAVQLDLVTAFNPIMPGVDLSEATIASLCLVSRQLNVRVPMQNAILDGMHLGEKSYFRSVDLTDSSAKNTVFSKTPIRDVIFLNADMTGTTLDTEYLEDVVLDRAIGIKLVSNDQMENTFDDSSGGCTVS